MKHIPPIVFIITIGLVRFPGCESDLTQPDLSGVWGGPHIELHVLGDSASVEYDCAHGTIQEPLRPDRRGQFSAQGIHVLEHGGPVREGEPLDKHPAKYKGWTDGQTMTLSIILTDTGEPVGTFKLTRNQAGKLMKCL